MKSKALVTLLLLALLSAGAQASAHATLRQRGDAEVVRGSLEEVKGRSRIALLVSRSLVVDVRDPALVALEDYRKAVAGSPPRQHTTAARRIADRLNRYIRKYESVEAAEGIEEADLVIVFKVTAQRPSLMPGQPFVAGKMYVLAIGRGRTPRLVWESESDSSTAEDAADDFIKALKSARGEK